MLNVIKSDTLSDEVRFPLYSCRGFFLIKNNTKQFPHLVNFPYSSTLVMIAYLFNFALQALFENTPKLIQSAKLRYAYCFLFHIALRVILLLRVFFVEQVHPEPKWYIHVRYSYLSGAL